MPKVSVIMPSLNVAKYIVQCMDSVINQTLKDIEIICVDAGSTDGTYEILCEYASKDSRIKVIHSDVKSYGYQMNIGLSNSSGEYIGIVETDDYIDCDMFERMYMYASDSSVDFVKGRYKEFVTSHNGKRAFLKRTADAELKKYVGKKINLRCNEPARFADLVHIWSGLYSRNFLNRNSIMFNETPGASFQDTSFSILVGLFADSCLYVDEAFYNYRIDNANSSVKSDSKIMCIVDEFNYIDRVLKEKDRFLNKECVLLLNRTKIKTYIWNFMRLSEKSANGFMEKVHGEVRQILDDQKFVDSLSSDEYQSFTMFASNQYREIYSEIEKKNDDIVNKLISCIGNNNECVLVCSGKYASIILFLQNFMGTDSIKAVCDNNKEIVGKDISGYTICDIESTVLTYPNSKYILANKYNYEVIFQQLTRMGISENNIVVFNDLPDSSIIIDMIKHKKI